MNVSMLVIAGLLSLAIPSLARSEQTQTAEVNEITDALSKLHASLNGKTVTMRGALGVLVGDLLYFQNDRGRFKVQFDAGRSARKKIEGCDLSLSREWTTNKCVFEVDAEIAVKEPFTLAEGGSITLIVYEIRD